MSVSLLLPMNGPNGSTVFTDYSPSPKTVTAYGNAQISTAQSRYYGSSGHFDGSEDYLVAGSASTFPLHAGDYTIELWALFNATPNGTALFSSGFTSASDAFPITIAFGASGSLGSVSGSVLYAGYFNGAFHGVFTSFTPVTGVWYHVAVSRESNVLRVFVDGVLRGSMTIASQPIAATRPLYIGRRWDTFGGCYHSGYIQDFRITVGAALYTANFTPPGRLAASISGTITDRLGLPCQRKVYAVSRPTDTSAPQILAHGLSDPTTGAYELFAPAGVEVTRVVVSEDDDPLLNDIVHRVTPG